MTDTTSPHQKNQPTPPTTQPRLNKLAKLSLVLGLLPWLLGLYLLACFIAFRLAQTPDKATSPVLWNLYQLVTGSSMETIYVLSHFALLASLLGILLGATILSDLRRTGTSMKNELLGMNGTRFILINVLGALIAVFIYLPLAREVRHQQRHETREKFGPSCSQGLKQLGVVFKMFAHESKGQVFPRLSPEPGKLMFANQNEAHPDPIYPEILSDLKIFACPEDEGVDWDATDDPTIMIDDQSYLYLGYAITNQNELQAFAQAYKQQIANGGNFAENLPAPEGTGTAGSNTLYRLQEDLDQLLPTNDRTLTTPVDFDAKLPTLIERTGHHEPPGGNVLYFDGHVEYIRLNEKWPMTDEALALLNALDNITEEQPDNTGAAHE